MLCVSVARDAVFQQLIAAVWAAEQPWSLQRTALVQRLDSHPGLGGGAGRRWARAPSPSLSVIGLIVRVHLAGLTSAFSPPSCGWNKGNPLSACAPGCLFGPLYAVAPSARAHVRSVLRWEDGLQRLKNGLCSSLFGNYLTRRGTGLDYSCLGVWRCGECLLPCLPSTCPSAVAEPALCSRCARGVSSTRCPVPLATAVPGCPVPLGGVSEAVVAHNTLPCLLACRVAAMCLEPKSAPAGGV